MNICMRVSGVMKFLCKLNATNWESQSERIYCTHCFPEDQVVHTRWAYTMYAQKTLRGILQIEPKNKPTAGRNVCVEGETVVATQRCIYLG